MWTISALPDVAGMTLDDLMNCQEPGLLAAINRWTERIRAEARKAPPPGEEYADRCPNC